jgi:hypothetical protein
MDNKKDNKKVKLYSRATYSVCGLNGECFVASATASSNKDSIDGQQSNVLAQLESVKSAIIGLNKLKRNQLQGLSKDTTTSSSSSDDGSGTTVTTTSPYGNWFDPMMTNVDDTPGQLCQNNADGIYYSSETINWTLSIGVNAQGCYPTSISGGNAIGYYISEDASLNMIYSTDSGATWSTSQSLSLSNIRLVTGTLSGLLGYICVASFQNTYNWYSSSDGGLTWTIISDYTAPLYSIGSSGTNILWSLTNGGIYYSTTNFPSTNSLLATYQNSLVAISGNYGLVAVYNKGVYIVNLSDTTPTLVQCYSTFQAWQGIYISDTPDSSGKISAIVSSQKQTIYCTDITATTIVWSVSSTNSIFQAAISGSNAIMALTAEDYLYYSSDYGSTWTST